MALVDFGASRNYASPEAVVNWELPGDVCVAAGPCIQSQRCVRWAASLPCHRLVLRSAVRGSWQ